MKFDFDFAMSVDINETVLKEMIAHCVEQQTGREVSSVEFKLKSKSMGDQRDSWTETILESAKVSLAPPKKESYRPKQPSPTTII
jgi:hypothetical protein